MDRRALIRSVSALTVASAGGCTAAGDRHPVVASPTDAPQLPVHQPAPDRPAPDQRASGRPAVLPAEIVHGPRDRANVALTFHGQGEPAMVTRLLSEIGAAGARVTVLAVGSWLEQYPDLGRRILDGGHELGNHTQHHAAINAMTADRAYAEIHQCAAQLRSLTGSVGRWFRPSQTLHANPTVRAAARRAGYSTCLSYDVDSRDYTDPGPAAVLSTTLGAVRAGSIVSLHFGHLSTVSAMGALLDGLRQRGLAPVTMTELTA